MRRHLLTTIAVIFTATILLSGAAEARANPGLSPRALKDQRSSARKMSRTLRNFKVPRSIQLAPLRAVRSGQKMVKVGSGKIKVNNNNVLPTKGTARITATRGLVSYKQAITNTRDNKTASYGFTAGRQGAGESVSIRKDMVHHQRWSTNKDGSREQVDKLVYPGKGGDALVATTVTTTSASGKMKSRTKYNGVSQVGKLGEVSYGMSEAQFKTGRGQTPYIFPGSN